MQAFFGAAGEGLYLECPVYANWGCNTYWGERCYANFNLTLVDDGEIFIGSHTMIGPNVTLVATGHPVRPDLRYQGAQYSLPVHIGENVWIGANVTVLPGAPSGTTRSLAPTCWSPRTSPPTRSPMAARAR